MPSRELIEAVAVTAELCGRTFSEAAARVFVADVSRFPEAQVIAALARCRREVRGALTVQDVVSRLEDGRPGVEQAWAQVPLTEAQSAVWTEEAAQAFGAALPLIERGDMVAARMAFKECYTEAVNRARDAGKPARWTITLGFDVEARKHVLEAAVADGRLPLEYARQFWPNVPAPAGRAIEGRIMEALQ